jgi:uncharacterized protein (TIGR03435 family)
MRWLLTPLLTVAALAQTPAAFDVTSIKPRKDQDTASRANLGDNGLLATNTTLLRMIVTAYGVTEQQVVDMPKWAGTARWDVQGKSLALPVAPRPEQVIPLLRKLLEDRFALRVHREKRQMPVYKLSVDRAGVKMVRAIRDSPGGEDVTSGPGGITMNATGVDMDEFARALTRRVGRPVVNETGLSGWFYFKLSWVPELADNSEQGPSVFTAIRESLGLRLEAGRDAVDVLVVDSASLPDVN